MTKQIFVVDYYHETGGQPMRKLLPPMVEGNRAHLTFLSADELVVERIDLSGHDGLMLPVYSGKHLNGALEAWGHPSRPVNNQVPFAYQIVNIHDKDSVELPPVLVYGHGHDLMGDAQRRLAGREGIEYLALDDNAERELNRWIAGIEVHSQ